MRFMVMIRADAHSEAGLLPTPDRLAAIGAFNQELTNAGVLLGGDGLHPSTKGARVDISSSGVAVTSGPFAETNELIVGYWVWELPSLNDAVAWAARCPKPTASEVSTIEIRQIFELTDFA